MAGRVPHGVRRAEQELETLLSTLDQPRPLTRDQAVVMGLALRGQRLYGAIRVLCRRGEWDSAAILLRALVEVTMLARWVEANPPLHVEMWLAEDERDMANGLEVVERLAVVRGLANPITAADRVRIGEARAEVKAIRMTAEAAGEAVRGSGSLIPNGPEMVKAVPDLADLYGVIYTRLTPTVHAGGRSFVMDRIETTAAGLRVRPGAPFQDSVLRTLSAPTLAFLLATVSRQCGLNIEAAATQIMLSRFGDG